MAQQAHELPILAPTTERPSTNASDPLDYLNHPSENHAFLIGVGLSTLATWAFVIFLAIRGLQPASALVPAGREGGAVVGERDAGLPAERQT